MKTVGTLASIIVVAIVGFFAIEWIMKATQQQGGGTGGGVGAGGGGSSSGNPFAALANALKGNALQNQIANAWSAITNAQLYPAAGGALDTTDPLGNLGVFIPPDPISDPFAGGANLPTFPLGSDPFGGGGGGVTDTSGLQTTYNDSNWSVD